MKLKLGFPLFLIFFGFNSISAQQFGAHIGLSVNFGTHVNSVGLISSCYYQQHFYQINLSSQTKFNFSSYGNRKSFAESRIAFGGLLLAGKKNNSIDFQLDALNHNTTFSNALGYNYIWYFDEIGTTQKSGAWAIHLNKFSILFENDVFGGQARDRFRTGVLQFSVRNEQIKYFTNIYIWTGETRNSIWIKEAGAKCPNGFRSLENLPFGKTSHGIFSIGATANTNFIKSNLSLSKNDYLTLKLGFDSEQVRHIFQNKLSHDLILFPKSMKRNTPHYPRLNQDGLPVFTKKEMRKNKLNFQLSSNDIWSN